MIKRLKSELNLRPTYKEMIGMIEDADKENRPPIEKIIDRRETLFRKNQYGSQVDNIDFLRIEEARRRKSKRKFGTSTIETSRDNGRNISGDIINRFTRFFNTC